MNSNFISEVGADHTIRYEVTDIYYRGIYEYKRSLPNDDRLKI